MKMQENWLQNVHNCFFCGFPLICAQLCCFFVSCAKFMLMRRRGRSVRLRPHSCSVRFEATADASPGRLGIAWACLGIRCWKSNHRPTTLDLLASAQKNAVNISLHPWRTPDALMIFVNLSFCQNAGNTLQPQIVWKKQHGNQKNWGNCFQQIPFWQQFQNVFFDWLPDDGVSESVHTQIHCL